MEIPNNLDVWVLAGQSNMQGCALLKGALEPDDRVFNFTSAGNWEIAQEPLHRLWESFTPIHQSLNRQWVPEDQKHLSDEELARIEAETRVCGAGLGISFGKAMADALGRPIGLIAAAHGGTGLGEWSPSRKDEGGESLYGAMLDRIKRAGGKLKGILWYQGEADCFDGVSQTYAQRFDDWIRAVRSDVGQPDLPVIVVQLGRFVSKADEVNARYWEIVRDAHRTLPDRMPNTAVTTTIDLELDDIIHVGTNGQIRLGKRLARLALDLKSGPKVERIEKLENDRCYSVMKLVCSGVTGGWKPRTCIRGFELRNMNNEPHELRVSDARVDPADPTAINIRISAEINDDCVLCYGPGLDPCCNVTDDADMPLCAFSSIEIS